MRKKKNRAFKYIIFLFIIIGIFVIGLETKPDFVSSIIMTPSSEDESPSSETVEDDEKIEEVEEDLLAETTYLDEEGNMIIKNIDDILVLVNKNRNLPSDYVPDDLVIPDVRFSFDEYDEKKQLRQVAADALKDLFDQASEEGIYLFAVSGYRSYDRQKNIFDYRADRDGFEVANMLSAYPGQSEHQTGLAMDVSSQSVGFDLVEEFGQTVEGTWLEENAHKFGFIIRYQEDAVDITGYSYEPWHIRYVGYEAANEIYERDITLEEYLGDI